MQKELFFAFSFYNAKATALKGRIGNIGPVCHLYVKHTNVVNHMLLALYGHLVARTHHILCTYHHARKE